MARTMRGHPKAWLQPEGAEETQKNINVPWQEESSDAAEDESITDYELDVDYKPEGSDPEIKADAQEEERNFNAEHIKMELPQQGTLHQRPLNHRVAEKIQLLHQA